MRWDAALGAIVESGRNRTETSEVDAGLGSLTFIALVLGMTMVAVWAG